MSEKTSCNIFPKKHLECFWKKGCLSCIRHYQRFKTIGPISEKDALCIRLNHTRVQKRYYRYLDGRWLIYSPRTRSGATVWLEELSEVGGLSVLVRYDAERTQEQRNLTEGANPSPFHHDINL
jgi:hypothetical protein